MKKLIAATAALLLTVSPALANGFSDNFDSEGGDATILNYTNFANFDVTTGSVDLLHDPNGYGLSCFGGTGGCVDLDGSSNQGGILTTKNFYAFNAGDMVTLSWQLSGNMRGAGQDNLQAGFTFAGSTSLINYTAGGGFGNLTFGNIPTAFLTGIGFFVADDTPFTLYSLSFKAGSAGSLQPFIGDGTNDNFGPILDNFNLSITGVPEPETWALMILGFGVIGAAMRRRTTGVVRSPAAA